MHNKSVVDVHNEILSSHKNTEIKNFTGKCMKAEDIQWWGNLEPERKMERAVSYL